MRSRSPVAGAVAAALLLGIGTPAAAARRPTVSWGKADVTMEAYRADALACGLRAYYTDLADTEQAAILRDASDQLKTLDGTGGTVAATPPGPATGGSFAGQLDPVALERARREGRIIETARPEKQIREVGALMRDRLAACLAGRGYTRFALTDAQDKALGRHKAGSDERRAYLHALASDPQIVEAQAYVPPERR